MTDAWFQFGMIWDRAPVFRAEWLAIMIGGGLICLFVGFAVTFVIMTILTRKRTIAAMPGEAKAEVALAQGERDVAKETAKNLEYENDQLWGVMNGIRNQIERLPSRTVRAEEIEKS